MKEVTYEDWQENPTPRKMWVWNDNEKERVQQKVLYIFFHDKGQEWNVSTLSEDETCTHVYKHCAEIENQRRMTNKELSRWLREKPTREYKHNIGSCNIVSCYSVYFDSDASKEVSDTILIRENDGDWREPLVEE